MNPFQEFAQFVPPGITSIQPGANTAGNGNNQQAQPFQNFGGGGGGQGNNNNNNNRNNNQQVTPPPFNPNDYGIPLDINSATATGGGGFPNFGAGGPNIFGGGAPASQQNGGANSLIPGLDAFGGGGNNNNGNRGGGTGFPELDGGSATGGDDDFASLLGGGAPGGGNNQNNNALSIPILESGGNNNNNNGGGGNDFGIPGLNGLIGGGSNNPSSNNDFFSASERVEVKVSKVINKKAVEKKTPKDKKILLEKLRAKKEDEKKVVKPDELERIKLLDELDQGFQRRRKRAASRVLDVNETPKEKLTRLDPNSAWSVLNNDPLYTNPNQGVYTFYPEYKF